MRQIHSDMVAACLFWIYGHLVISDWHGFQYLPGFGPWVCLGMGAGTTSCTHAKPIPIGRVGVLQSTLFFAWTFPWSHDPIPPSRQTASAQEPVTHYIPQCYATRPHEQATTPYESTPCRGPPSSCGHAPSNVYRAIARAPSPGAPCRAPCPYPLEYPPPPVLLYGGVRRARDAEPSIPACGRLGQSYVGRATARARSSHALPARQPRRPHAYSVT